MERTLMCLVLKYPQHFRAEARSWKLNPNCRFLNWHLNIRPNASLLHTFFSKIILFKEHSDRERGLGRAKSRSFQPFLGLPQGLRHPNTLRMFFAAFPVTPVGSWIRSETAGSWTSAHMGCQLQTVAFPAIPKYWLLMYSFEASCMPCILVLGFFHTARHF